MKHAKRVPGSFSRRTVLSSLAGASALALVRGPVSVFAAPAAAAGELPRELWRAGAAELARAIAGKQVTSLPVVEALLARIGAVNPKVNAVVRTLADSARALAREADRAVAAGARLGPLHGVPFTIKENVDLAGSPTTQGVNALAAAIAPSDAPVVERWKAAGGIPLGRTNLPDFGLRVHPQSSLHGRTLNPWHPGRNVGGSSGGEGAALATGMSPLGIGNDIGGSLRNPAHCCGIASLKPSLGRIPHAAFGSGGGSPAGQLMAVQGPMARRIEDVRLGYRLMAGPHRRDPWSMPIAPVLEPLSQPPRVALFAEPSGGTTHPSVARGVRLAGDALRAAGYLVEEVEPPRLPLVYETWGHFIATDLHLGLEGLGAMMGEEAMAFLRPSIEILGPVDLAGYTQLLGTREELAAQWQEFFARSPLIVGPVFTQPPFEIGYDIAGRAQIADVLNQLRFVVCANLLGLPAVCVPVGIEDGLPRGVQVMGDRYREEACLDAAQVIEAAHGLATPIDPVAG